MKTRGILVSFFFFLLFFKYYATECSQMVYLLFQATDLKIKQRILEDFHSI